MGKANARVGGIPERFERVGQIGGRPAALGSDESDLYVALHSNEVKRLSDAGRSWSVRVAA